MSTKQADQPLKHVAEMVNEATEIDWKASVRTAVHAILNPLASLRLTVVLLVLSVLVIWVVTLEQTRYDIWTVKQKHFPDLMVLIPFQTFFPPAWFPEMQNIPGSFLMPSGTLILILMIVNLAAAHLVRMRVQARSSRLWLGIGTLVAGVLVTWGVIFYGQNPNGGSGGQPGLYQFMWRLIQFGMLGLGVLSVGAIFRLEKHRLVEKVMLGVFAFTNLAVLVFLVFNGKDAFIGDSAMRILWQLIQSTIAALILLAGCMLVFKRKGGIVLIHLGIGLLMVNELYVTMTNVEQRMTVIEGQTVSHTIDLRSTELMVMRVIEEEIDGEVQEKHEVVQIPRSELLKDQVISSDQLPFDVECLEYYPNSELIRGQGVVKNPANTGIGTVYVSRELPLVAGVDDNEMDMASAYVRLTEKGTDKEIGVYLASQLATLNNAYDEVEIDGQTYFVGLRFQHYYKPYSITLKDVERQDYVGTTTAKSYSSKFDLDDHEKGVVSPQRIWMNNPLRYGDETFYQSGHDFTKDGRELTVMQIVKNSGWMIPYVACMIVVVGLFAQFGSTLLKFLENAQQRSGQRRPTPDKDLADGMLDSGSSGQGDAVSKPLAAGASHVSKGSKVTGWIAIAFVVLFGVYVGMKAGRAAKTEVDLNGMRLDQLGEVAVTYKGRVQPLDSLARNTLRKLANREEVVYPGAERKLFGMRVEKQPAIRWLADVIFKAEGYDKVQVLRIEDLSVAGALGLPKSRKGLKYSLAELERARPELDRLMKEVNSLEEEQLTPLHKRLIEVQNKLELVYGISLALSAPPKVADRVDPIASMLLSSRLIQGSAPRNVYLPDDGWVPLPVAIQREKIKSIASEHGLKSLREVAQKLVETYLVEPERKEIIKEVLIAISVQNEQMVEEIKKENNLTDLRQVVQFLSKQIDARSDQDEELPVVAQLEVDRQMAKEVLPNIPLWEDQIHRMMVAINNKKDEVLDSDSEQIQLQRDAMASYLEGDAEKFNASIASILEQTRSNPPKEYSAGAMRAEKVYNGFSPFSTAIVLYFLAALMTLIGWCGLSSVRKAAFWMIVLALVVHVFGICLRVWISGRPPVTNLYSSFIVVSAASVGIMLIVEAVTRIGIGNMLAGVSGIALLIWAWTISIRDGDTFSVLVAVLDTQFWLSTHVMCISLGYAATVAAGLIGFAFLAACLVAPKFDKGLRTTFSKLIYGIVCFALLLSFFGTVLGGLWGDDSWGRFWGWDPKENGALMIVFWNAVVLHARWGGMVRERGLAGLAIVGNIVTLWSWEGVNQLGVGLHSYGVSEGRLLIIIQIAVLHCALAALAMIPVRYWANVRREAS